MQQAAAAAGTAATAEVIAAATGRPIVPGMCMGCSAPLARKSQRFCNETCYGDLCAELVGAGHNIVPVCCSKGQECRKLATEGKVGLPVFGSQYGKQCWHCWKAAKNTKQQAQRADQPTTGPGRGRPRKNPSTDAHAADAASSKKQRTDSGLNSSGGSLVTAVAMDGSTVQLNINTIARLQQEINTETAPAAAAAAAEAPAKKAKKPASSNSSSSSRVSPVWTHELLLALIAARKAGYGPKTGGKGSWGASGSALAGFSRDDLSKKWAALVSAAAGDAEEAVIRNKGGAEVTLGAKELQDIRQQAARERG